MTRIRTGLSLVWYAIARGLVSLQELRRAAEVRTDLESIDAFRQGLRDFE